MDLAQYYDLIRSLPSPTDEQVARFAHHVQFAHSWYKHLPLDGEEFVIFFDPGAGGGFTEAQPRLHHTWQTRRQYLGLFGHLAYMHRATADSPFTTDYALNARVAFSSGRGHFVDRVETAVLELPQEILRDCGFMLYPFAWDNSVFERRFEEQLRRIAAGEREHRLASLLTDYWRTDERRRPIYEAFHAELRRRFREGLPCRGTLEASADRPADEWAYVRAEKEALRAIARDPERSHELSPVELEYFRPHGGVTFATLMRHEVDSIKSALTALRRHLDAAGCGPPSASPEVRPVGRVPEPSESKPGGGAESAASLPGDIRPGRVRARLGSLLEGLAFLLVLCALLVGPCLLVSAAAESWAVSAFIRRSAVIRVKFVDAAEEDLGDYRICYGLLEFRSGRDKVQLRHAIRLSDDEHCPAESHSIRVRYDPLAPKDARVDDELWDGAVGRALLGLLCLIPTALVLQDWRKRARPG